MELCCDCADQTDLQTDRQSEPVSGSSFFKPPHLPLWSAVSLNPDPVDESCASSQSCLAAVIARTQPDKQLLTI